MATQLSHTTLTNPIPGWRPNHFSFPIPGTGSVNLCYIQWSLCRTQLNLVAPLRNKCKKRHKCCPAVRSEAKSVSNSPVTVRSVQKEGRRYSRCSLKLRRGPWRSRLSPAACGYHMEQISTCRHGGAHSETVDVVWRRHSPRRAHTEAGLSWKTAACGMDPCWRQGKEWGDRSIGGTVTDYPTVYYELCSMYHIIKFCLPDFK